MSRNNAERRLYGRTIFSNPVHCCHNVERKPTRRSSETATKTKGRFGSIYIRRLSSLFEITISSRTLSSYEKVGALKMSRHTYTLERTIRLSINVVPGFNLMMTNVSSTSRWVKVFDHYPFYRSNRGEASRFYLDLCYDDTSGLLQNSSLS